MIKGSHTPLTRIITITLGILFGGFLFPSHTVAQEINPNYFTLADGLASPGINVIMQDSYGLLWISTQNGVQVYDGYHFETYKHIPGDPSSLLNNTAWGITEDKSHNLWVANDLGISKLDRATNTFTNYNLSEQFNMPGIGGRSFGVFQDSKNRLWASSGANELLSYDPSSDRWDYAEYVLSDPSEEVNHLGILLGIAEDIYGGLWIGSANYGLMYCNPDDSVFKPVPISQVDFTDRTNTITRLYADSTNVVWITSRNGVYKYDSEKKIIKTFKTYDYREFFIWNHWNCIKPDPEGNIWITNNFRGMLKFEGISDSFEEINVADSYFIPGIGWNITLSEFIVDKSGIFWMGSVDGGLIKYDPQKNPFSLYTHDDNNTSSISSNSVFGLLASRVNPDILYVGTKGSGLNIFDQKEQRFRQITFTVEDDIYGGSVRSIVEDEDGSLWLGTWGDGLIELDQHYNEINRYTFDQASEMSISDNRIRVIEKDDNGNFWVGTNRGLNYFNTTTREFRRINSRESRTYPRELTDIINKKIVDNNAIAKITDVTDFKNLSEAVEIKEAGNYLIATVCEETTETIADFGWIENSNHDTIWSSNDFYRSYHAGGATKNRIFIDMIFLDAGKYYLRYYSDDSHSFNKWNSDPPEQTTLYGIVLIQPSDQHLEEDIESILESLKVSKEIAGFSINAIEVTDSVVWVGSNLFGLNGIDRASDYVKVYSYDPANKNSLSNNQIFDICEDKNGKLWIATHGGVNRFDPSSDTFTTYTEKDGLPTNLTESILLGDEGEIWISTMNGLSQMVTNEKLGKVTFINYNAEDGLGGNTFVAQVAARTNDGKFYFGGDHGLNSVSSIQSNNVPPEIIISDLLISNQSVYELYDELGLSGNILELKEVNLSHFHNDLSFEFAALHYANPKKNQYAHFLKGFDKDWVYDNRNFASYTNLDPGEYEFVIRASNAYGVWNEEGKSIRIIISPPWWKTGIAYVIYAILFILFLFGFDRFMRRRMRMQERERSREKELEQAREIEKAYTELKATQTQLIQSEKMASLGELTAGIAHEIQNPLNFVNNFSDVNTELIQELKEEIDKKSWEDVKAIADDIAENEEKIKHHGKRADSIVKGMLQHSRSNSTVKEPTDINAMADEYLRLAFHGLRAKDKSFNADFKTVLDESLPKINVNPQEMGRVMLNLINNAFYAVAERSHELLGSDNLKGNDYKPLVTVTTIKKGEKVEIRVSDNGKGMTADLIKKIFQPFFTTKPTGKGTGLGLSLAYDIITKGHGGELKVETREGEGSEFIIQLPISS